MKKIFFLVAAIGLLGIDRWLKWLALSGQTASWWIGRFELWRNDALVFSWPAPNWLAIVLAVIISLGVLWLCWRAWKKGEWRKVSGTIFILLGAYSNLYDRIVHGFVIDWGYLGPWWPVFNLADVMILVGVIIYLWPKQKIDNPQIFY